MVDEQRTTQGQTASRARSTAPAAGEPTLSTAELAVVQPRRNAAMWTVCGLLVVVVVLAVVIDAQAGVLALAGVMAAAGVTRAVVRGPVAGITVRSRAFDLVLYFGLAAVLTFLAQTAPRI